MPLKVLFVVKYFCSIIYLGKRPYEGLTISNVMHHVCINNGHLDVPQNCPEVMKNHLLQCWKFNPSERPSFSSLLIVLEEFLNTQRNLIE